MKMKQLSAAAVAFALIMSAAPSAAAHSHSHRSVGCGTSHCGWVVENGINKYLREDNTYACDTVMTIDGILYSFNHDGSCSGAYTGFARKDGHICYYDNGHLHKGGWLNLPSGTYYIQSGGIAATGSCMIDGQQYLFRNNGALAVTRASDFNVYCDRPAILAGEGQPINITVTAGEIAGEATFANINEMHYLSNGKWYKLIPDDAFTIPEILYSLNSANKSAVLTFYPEEYCPSPEAGRYRAVINISTDSGQITKYAEFDIAKSAVLKAPAKEFYLADTNKIMFTAFVNNDTELYALSDNTLYGRLYRMEEDGVLHAVTDNYNADANIYTVPMASGSVFDYELDLTGYDKQCLKSGKYTLKLGDELSCEFTLKNPFDADVEQIPLESRRKKQVKVTVTNSAEAELIVNGYGRLKYYNTDKQRWDDVPLKKDVKLDTQMSIPAMHKWTKTLLLTDYYELGSLKKGSYRMIFPAENGYEITAGFELK